MGIWQQDREEQMTSCLWLCLQGIWVEEQGGWDSLEGNVGWWVGYGRWSSEAEKVDGGGG